MYSEEIEIYGSEALNALSYAEQIEQGVKDSLQQARELQAYVISSHWNGKTRNAFLSYLELLIQFNTKMAEALEGHTKALKELDEHIQSFTNHPEVKEIKKL